MTVIFMVLILFAVVSVFIKYPDVIVGRISITTQTLPAVMKAQRNGKISHILVKENQMVKKGELLAILDNAANYRDIEKVREQLAAFTKILYATDSLLQIRPERNVNLGELQQSYAQMWRSYQDYEFFVRNNFYKDKIARLEQQMQTHRSLLPRMDAQQEIMQREFKLLKSRYEADQSLVKSGSISQVEFENTEKEYLQGKYRLENLQMESLRANLQMQNYQKEILDIQTQFSENQSQVTAQLRQSVMNFEAQLTLWEESYLFRAPIDGHISFFKMLAEQQMVGAGEEVMTIVPAIKEIFGYTYLPSQGFGEVEQGQRVLIRFDGYEFKEFGSVHGVVRSKGNIAKDGKYLVKIALPQGLRTNYEKNLDFSQDMQGEAHIVTKDLRLIERIFYQFKHLFVE